MFTGEYKSVLGNIEGAVCNPRLFETGHGLVAGPSSKPPRVTGYLAFHHLNTFLVS